MKIGLKRIDMQEGVTMETLLDSRATELVMSSEFVRKQRFEFKKITNPIYIRNVDKTFNKERPMKNTMKIEGQKCNMILGMLWLACHNPEINWRTGEVRMIRCPKECEK